MMIKLREYQKEALEHALKQERATLVLPTGTGKTIIGFFFVKKLLESKAKRALVLVPTRILVEQTAGVYRSLGLEVVKIYGIFDQEKRKELWKRAKVAVATPETFVNDLSFAGSFDVVVVDEAHHAVGKDAYVKALSSIDARFRLGLSAFIPKKARKLVEALIGPIKEWRADDPKLKPYVPDWIGDIFEAPFNERELKVYRAIEEVRKNSKGAEKLLATSALKFFARDGAIALLETLGRSEKMRKLFPWLEKELGNLRNMHKIEALLEILGIYEYSKAIIFVDRLIIAKKLHEFFEKRKIDVALVLGRKAGGFKLDEVRGAEVIISTSAGEEGVDLPTADLLVNWSNTSNPLRFIQRHGRIMRKTKQVKFVTYILTPQTIDVDAFLNAVYYAKRIIDINIDPVFISRLWKASGRRRIIELLSEPMPKDWLKEISGATESEVSFALKHALEEGEVIYIHTPHLGRVYCKKDFAYELFEKFAEFLEPRFEGKVKIAVGSKKRSFRGSFRELLEKLSKKLPLNGIEVVVIKKEQEVEAYAYRRYDFIIDSKFLLELVLRNALSFF